MTTPAKNCRATIIPGLRYRDAPAMIEWLCRAFGFEKQAVYDNPDGTVAHAQLTFGNGMIMLGSLTDGGPFDSVLRHPDQQEKTSTQSPYLVVEDCDGVYARALAAGADMVMPIEDKDYGGRGFTCRDPEGHLWRVGSYDPWA